MEDVTFVCEECGKRITFPGNRRGHIETCPECSSYVDVPDGSMSASAPPEETPTTTRTHRELWIEVLAVLCLAYFPYMLYAIAIATGWHSTDCPFVYDSVGRIIESLQVIAPLLVILALSKDRWATFGIVRFGWLADVGGGLVLWSLALAIYYLVVAILPRWTDHASERHSQGIAEGCLTLGVCVVFARPFARPIK